MRNRIPEKVNCLETCRKINCPPSQQITNAWTTDILPKLESLNEIEVVLTQYNEQTLRTRDLVQHLSFSSNKFRDNFS